MLGHGLQAAEAVSQPGEMGLFSGTDLSSVLSKCALGLTLTTPNSLSLEHRPRHNLLWSLLKLKHVQMSSALFCADR